MPDADTEETGTVEVLPLRGRILCVEDDPSLLELYGLVLTEFGHTVKMATTGNEALVEARAHHPDLIILDVMLPGTISGMEVCTHLRARQATRRIPIIFVSALVDEEHKIAALRNGADDYLTKPFDIGELEARIEALLRRSRSKE